ncbi:uncharacterized protein FIESC28_08700 [Fusarium coffeatum]|uniref:Uncharacterized protein n=1 Tax=Fusarium coffeatum TaxID=231269 RepID=A0A366R4W9_9HYPO|nr:uncharacterized protein FIESC28_08700 [Fusarium coffeatum]RBR12214.1 hypothetical protein FIESC28_08700 [Fusarium coffeatum]
MEASKSSKSGRSSKSGQHQHKEKDKGDFLELAALHITTGSLASREKDLKEIRTKIKDKEEERKKVKKQESCIKRKIKLESLDKKIKKLKKEKEELKEEIEKYAKSCNKQRAKFSECSNSVGNEWAYMFAKKTTTLHSITSMNRLILNKHPHYNYSPCTENSYSMKESKQAPLYMPCITCCTEKLDLVKQAPLTVCEMWVEQEKKREELVEVQLLIEDMDRDIKWKKEERRRLADQEEKLMEEFLEYGKLVREAEKVDKDERAVGDEEALKNWVW